MTDPWFIHGLVAMAAGIAVAGLSYLAISWIAAPEAPHGAEFYVGQRLWSLLFGVAAASIYATFPGDDR